MTSALLTKKPEAIPTSCFSIAVWGLATYRKKMSEQFKKKGLLYKKKTPEGGKFHLIY